MRWRTKILIALLVMAAAAGLYLLADWWFALPPGQVATYLGSEACWECHREEFDQWTGSDHDRAMDPASPETVEGDFDGTEYHHVPFLQLTRLAGEELARVTAEAEPRQWALALHDADEAFAQKILAAMPEDRAERVRQERNNPVPVRPCDVTMAQCEIGNVVRRLEQAGEIQVPFGVRTRMARQGNRFRMTTDNRDGQMEEFSVKYTLGIRPLQQYLVEFPDGRIQCLPIAWDTERREWFHVYGGEAIPHDDQLHWTGPRQNWNYMCAECHTTDLRKNFDTAENAYRTAWSEMGVGCEACHGPGSLHVQLARSGSVFWDRRYGMGLPRLKGDDPRVEIETCGPCHARRQVVYPGFHGGAPFLDHCMLQLLSRPEWLEREVYYADGQILDEDYVYGSFIQSRMYREQVRCSNCHNPHSGRVKFQDNRLCGQCHLPTKYDTPQHHHHPDDTKPGTLCVECHMPETTYMAADPRRDHSIRVPRPDLTVDLDIPNACNLCHHDQAKGETPEWAAERCRQWYGDPEGPEHFAYAFAAARQGKPEGEPKLVAVTNRTDLSAMIRASAIQLLRQYGSGDAEAAAIAGLEDPDALVRAASVGALEIADEPVLRRHVLPMLGDPLRAVRSEAVRVLSPLGPRSFLPQDRQAFEDALAEFMECQQYLAHHPGSHMMVGVIRRNLVQRDLEALQRSLDQALRLGAAEPEGLTRRYHDQVRRLVRDAEAAYRTALRIDPQFAPVRMNLAMLVYEYGDKAESERLYREVIQLAPEYAGAYYNLALLLAEDPQRLAEAAELLATAARLAPGHARIRYNAGLAFRQTGRNEEAERELLAAYRLAPNSPDFLYALADLYAKTGRRDKAIACAEALVRLQPQNGRWQLLLDHLRAEGATEP